MKTKQLIISLFLSVFFINSNAQTQKNIPVSAFEDVEISGAYTVYLTQANNYSVKIEADKEILDLIEFDQTGKEINLTIEDYDDIKINSDKKIILWISTPKLSNLVINGAVHLECANTWNLQELYIEINGASKMDWDLNIQYLDLELNGASAVYLNGNAQKANVIISGAGTLDAKDLITQNFNIDLSGAGNANIFVNNSLTANISGIGFIKYYGNPDHIESDISLLGVLENAQE